MIVTLTDAERGHLLNLLAQAKDEGTYYGNRAQYRKRALRLWVKLFGAPTGETAVPAAGFGLSAGSDTARRTVLEEVVAMERLAETRGLRLSGVYSAASMLLGEMDVDEGKCLPADQVFAALRSRLTASDDGNPMPDTHTPGDLYHSPPNPATSPEAASHPGEGNP